MSWSAPSIRQGWVPTGALMRAVLVGVVGVAAGVLAGRPALLVLAAPFLVAAAVALAHRPTGEPSVRVAAGSAVLREGQGVRVPLHLDGVEDAEQLTRVLTPAHLVVARPAHGQLVVPMGESSDLEISPRRWGHRPLGTERVALGSRWSGYQWGPTTVVSHPVRVVPASPPYDSRVDLPQPWGIVGAHRSTRPGSGTELDGIRPFQPGDRLKRISWRVSARTGTLHVATTRSELDAGLVLVVDALADVGASGGVDGRASSLDLTVRATAALAEHAVRQGDRVALRPVGGHIRPVRSGSGRRHLSRVLGTLADLQPGSTTEDVSRLELRVGAGATVVVLSPLLDDALGVLAADLTRRGVPTLVVDTMPPDVVPDLGDAAADLVALAWRLRRLEREQVVTHLTAAGAPVVPWAGTGSVDEALRQLARRSEQPRMRS